MRWILDWLLNSKVKVPARNNRNWKMRINLDLRPSSYTSPNVLSFPRFATMRLRIRRNHSDRKLLRVEWLESRVNPVSFAEPVGYTTPANTFAAATGDFNGDGKPDVVTSNTGGVCWSSEFSVALFGWFCHFTLAKIHYPNLLFDNVKRRFADERNECVHRSSL